MEPNKIITDYHSCRDLIKYQLIEEDVGTDGMTIWYKETFVTLPPSMKTPKLQLIAEQPPTK